MNRTNFDRPPTSTAPDGRFGIRWTAGLAALIAFTLGFALAYQGNRIARSETQLAGITTQLLGTRDELGTIRANLQSNLGAPLERVARLEACSRAAPSIIAAASPSIVFLQGAYGFQEAESGRALRYVLGPDDKPIWTPLGPALDLEGAGPVIEHQFTGTAFVATADRLLLTNRHVVFPWEHDETAQRLTTAGLVPVMHRLVGYLPGTTKPLELELVSASDEADVAILRSDDIPSEIPHLELRFAPPESGEAVIVMGYPTGMKALLARAGRGFVTEIAATEPLDFWGVGRKLSTRRHIHPLATGGSWVK